MNLADEELSVFDYVFGITLAAIVFAIFAILFYNGWPAIVKAVALGIEGMGL